MRNPEESDSKTLNNKLSIFILVFPIIPFLDEFEGIEQESMKIS